MFSKMLSATALALMASSLVSAQTFTECDPTKKDCPPDPAFGTSAFIDFTKGPSDKFKALAGTSVNYDNTGAVFAINKETDAPTMASHGYIFFGRIDMELKAAHGAGVVTSVVLQSNDLDEIDWEWVGGDDAQVQTNYFSKGDTSTYDRGKYHAIANPTTKFYKYSIEWTRKAVVWSVNGAPVRTLTYDEAKGGSTFPQTPMQIKFGTWVAGRKDAPEGTVNWAGGYTNFADAPFVAIYKSINIVDYAGGDGPGQAVSGAKKYVWSDKSGTWQSIKVSTEGGGEDSSDNDKVTTAIPTHTTQTSKPVPTTLATTTSKTSSTSDASPTEGSDNADGNDSGSGSKPTTATSDPAAPAASSSNRPASGYANQANLALGVVGLFAAFLF